MRKWVQITSGRGPRECQWMMRTISDKFLSEAKDAALYIDLISEEYDGQFLRTVIFAVEGEGLQSWLTTWIGAIQWTCKSPLRPFHKRKNWFVECFVMDGTQDLDFDEREVVIKTMRSTGAGGQHVNKVSTAVQAKHLPTGFFVEVMDTRSQFQNRKIAMERLRYKMMCANLDVASQKKHDQWLNAASIQRGNPVRVYVGIDFKKK